MNYTYNSTRLIIIVIFSCCVLFQSVNSLRIPLVRIESSKKRAVRVSGDSVFLGGGIDTVAEFFAEVGLGTPPQNLYLQVDTGSSDLLVFGSTCSACSPASATYSYSLSSTEAPVLCTNPNYICKGCLSFQGVPNTCRFADNYGDGTVGANGSVITDKFRVGDISNIDVSFGYIGYATGGFENYPVDGIWGLAYRALAITETVFENIVAQTGINNVFSLCLQDGDGMMTLGEDYSLNPAFVWTAITLDQYYNVQINDVLIGGSSLGFSLPNYNSPFAVVDSGTTLLLFSPAVFNAIANNFIARGLTGTPDIFNGYCVQMSASQKAAFPTVTINLNGAGPLTITNDQYLIPFIQGGITYYCLGIGSTGSIGGTILGDVFMTAFHVVFDRAHNKVGFGPISTCPSQAGLITATVTTQPLTTHTLTTSSVTTQPLTTHTLTTSSVTIQPLTTHTLTTSSVTIQPLTTHTLTTSSVTIQPLTTHTLTTSSVTIQPLTTHTLTTSSATIQPLTTHTLTTSPSITSGRLLTTGSSVQICHFEDMFSNLNCIGLLFSYPNIPNQVYSFADFYTISFNNFTANTGDIEGSLAVQNNYNVQAGFSVGYGSPSVLTYSLVVGNNANWTSGSIYNGNIFVGESFIASADLILKRTGNCASPNCLANAFNNAQSCYIQFSSYSAGLPVNTVSTTVNSVFTITCNNFGDLQYVVQVNSTTISNTNQIQFLNCNPQNSVVINVLKANAISDVVNFNVGNWIISGFKSSSILWNFPGSGRTVNVHTSISGNMLCPESTLNQQAGTIWGKVVAGDIAFVTQINLPVCPPKYVTTNALTTKGLTTAGITSGIQQSVTTGFDLQQLNKVMNQTCLFFEKDSILNPPCNGYELTFPGDSNIYSFLNYAIISFGDFIANTGDVTGAIAIDRNFLVSNGFSVGGDAWFKNPIPPTPYTMIVGHNATWNSGSLLQNAFSSTGKMFVGSVLNAPSYLALQRTGSCPNNNINCLDSEFSNLQQCYNSLSANLALGITNVNPVLTGGTLSLTCTSSLSTRYYISLTDLILNQVTSYVLVNCNTNANYVINVLGSGDILFQGNAFPLSSNKAGNIVYNIIGSGRTIRSTNYVQGSILGPSNTLFQNSGFIVGKIIVGNISMSTQINAPTCSTSFN